MDAMIEGLHVDDGGQGGVPVVFVPSAAGTAAQWKPQLDHLRPGRRAVALELRGHGTSTAAAARDTPVEAFAEDVGTVADAVGLSRFVLVGHSFGAAVAACFAARRPERVAGLLLVDPASDARPLPPEEVQGFLEALASDGYLELALGHWSSLLEGSGEEVRGRVLEDLRRTPQDTLFATLRCLLQFDPIAALRGFPGPRRAWVTRYNDLPTAYHRLVPELPVERFDGVAHWLHLDAPQAANAALDRFLREVDGEAPGRTGS